MLIGIIAKLKQEKESLKDFFKTQLGQQMEVLNEDFEEALQDEKMFFRHLFGLQNKADYLLDSLNQLKSSLSNVNPEKKGNKSSHTFIEYL